MRIRRVVTGKNGDGKSVVVSDGYSPREVVFEHTPGFVSSPLWRTHATPDLREGHACPMQEVSSLLAVPGGAVFMLVTFPPDSVMAAADFDAQKAVQEHLAAVPGITETFEPDNPGMHATPTLDFATVVKGVVVLELDDGQTVTLGPGDAVVQHGARHAWRNPGNEPATLSVVMLGART